MAKNNSNNKQVTRNMIIMIILLIIIFGGIFGYGLMRSIFTKRYFASFTPPPVIISTTKAQLVTWQPSIASVGSLVAVNGVQVAPELPGVVEKIYFESGQMVKAGDPLVQIDDADDRQDLNNLLAQLKLAEITYHRQSVLYKNQAAARVALDQAVASLDQLRAQVAKTKVIIAKKHIVAPFAGKTGIRLVNLGQYVAAGAPLVSLQSMDPLYANFSLPQQYLQQLFVGQPVQVSVDAFADQIFPGKITAINAEVNSSTRNILVQATIPNPQLKLYPGMFANIEVMQPAQQKVIVVPQTAVTYNLYGNSVYVVKADGKDKSGKPILKAHMQYVTTGDKQGNQTIVTQGLQAGDEIVTSGQLKLSDGAEVTINNSVKLNQGSP